MLELIIPVYIFSEIISTLKKKLAIPSKLKIASAEKSAENPQKKTELPSVLRLGHLDFFLYQFISDFISIKAKCPRSC